jgi:hypothetical protein
MTYSSKNFNSEANTEEHMRAVSVRTSHGLSWTIGSWEDVIDKCPVGVHVSTAVSHNMWCVASSGSVCKWS